MKTATQSRTTRFTIVFVCLLALALGLFGIGVINAAATTPTYTGTGTSFDDPYVVSTSDEFTAAIESTDNSSNYIRLDACLLLDSGATVSVDTFVDLNGYTINTNGTYISGSTAMTFRNGYINAEGMAFFNSASDSTGPRYILENLVVENERDLCVYVGYSGTLNATNCSFTGLDETPIEVNRSGAVFNLTDCYLEGSTYAYKQSTGTLTLEGAAISGNASSVTYNGGFVNSITDKHAPLSGSVCTVCSVINTHKHNGETFEELTQDMLNQVTSALGGEIPAGTYYLSDNITAGGDLTIASDATVSLCLNGKTLDLGAYQITNNGTLRIYDCVDSGIVTSTVGDASYTSGGRVVTNEGTMQLYGGTIRNTGAEKTYHIAVYNSGTLEISGGTVSSATRYAVYNVKNLSMSGGTVSSGEAAVYNYNSNATAIISGGTITATAEYSLYNWNGDLTVSGGTVVCTGTSSSDYAFFTSAGTATITGGTITGGSAGIRFGGGTLTIDSGKITGSRYGIYMQASTGRVNVNGGSVTGACNGIFTYTTNTEKASEIYITGGSITGTEAESTDRPSGVCITVGYTAVISGGTVSGYHGVYNYGTVTVSGTATVNGTGGNGIYNHTGTDKIQNNTTVTGGTITGKTNGISCVAAPIVLTVTGGTIRGENCGIQNNYTSNTVTISGNNTLIEGVGGIYTAGTLEVTGGTIRGSTYGIRQVVLSSASEISGGSIIGTAGAGMLFENGTANISGGEISGEQYSISLGSSNSGTNTPTLYLSGSPVIEGNDSTHSGIYVDRYYGGIYAREKDGTAAYAGGALTVRLKYPSNGTVLIQEVTSGNKAQFKLANADYLFLEQEDDLVLHTHKYEYAWVQSGDAWLIRETCGNGCTHTATATIGFPDGLIYTGEALRLTLTTDSGWVGTSSDDYTLKVKTSKDSDYVTATEIKNAGDYIATFTNLRDDASVKLTYSFTVDKASQSAPTGIGKVDTTYIDTTDGKITGVTTAMEYQSAGADGWTKVSGTTVAELASGTYYVRYAGTVNYTASDSVSVTIEKGDKRTGAINITATLGKTYDGTAVTVPTKGNGYTYNGDGVVTITWYADDNHARGDALTGAPKNAGTYWVGISAAEGTNYKAVSEVTEQFVIEKATYDMTGVTFEDGSYTYDGGAHSLTLTGTLPTGADGIQVTVSYSGSATDVADDGVTITATFATTSANYHTPAAKTATVTINPKNISGATITLGDALTYNGSAQTQTVTSVVIDGLNATFTLTGNTETNVKADGNYTLTATGNGNFTGTATATWNIMKATYDMTDITFVNKTVVYNGETHSVVISGMLPTGVMVTYDVSGKTAAGVYTITAAFTGDSTNYEAIAPMTATLTIKQDKISDHNGEDTTTEEPPHVEVTAEDGFAPDVKIVIETVAPENVETGSAVRRNEKVSHVYDITMMQGDTEIQPDGDISIRLLIPAELADKVVRLIHNHDGEFTEIAFEEDAGYAVFTIDRLSEFFFVYDDTANLGWLIILLCIIIALQILLAVFFFLRIRKGGGRAGTLTVGMMSLFLSMFMMKGAYVAPGTIATLSALGAAVIGMTIFDVLLGIKMWHNTSCENAEKTEEEPSAPAEQVENTSDTADDIQETAIILQDGTQIPVRFQRSFTAKLMQASEDTKAFYVEIRNYLLTFKGVKCRISWKAATFNMGRKQLVKLTIKGKTLNVNLALNPADYPDTYIKVTDMSDSKTYASVPFAMKVKSSRGVLYAKRYIDDIVSALALVSQPSNDTVSADDYPYKDTKTLIEEGLIKVKAVNGEEITNLDDIISQPFAIRHSVTVAEAHSEMSDEIAMSLLGEKKTRTVGRKYPVNIDVLSAEFEEGDTVDIDKLKERGIVPKRERAIKILARGTLDKALIVIADDYSADAVKMIVLVGGNANLK